MAIRVIALSCVVFLVSLIGFAAAMATTADQCQYVVRVKTGNVDGAGTDSTISLKLKSQSGDSFTIANLLDWGSMEPGHVYFDRDNLDIFNGRSNCLDVCAMTVTSSGTGSSPRWYLNYVQVTVSGPVRADISFPVNGWLAEDKPPHSLSANVDSCSSFYPLKPALFSV
ncbi:PLAT domain-containing protein 3-like [Neltuma alba]|uniref:PLAT domain-containing protein 3-like n=1 Tax=Neltuma alba TaxID=207710 RepID=UPI0010A35070|nr:PLAT domain-containing protein 3-like [Prosopis alba]XP_028790929.1 PLAT domain-containing protein 3-like [Prosopis alba]XP_028790935.1 PLAT domain-containing protein 3-like [Prosopis alba]